MASVARSVGRRRQLEDWKALPWKKIQRGVFRLQQRIYQAERRGEYFETEDVIEVHHWDRDRLNNRCVNLVLLHGHCHDDIHGKRC
jgi:hypothetical protein